MTTGSFTILPPNVSTGCGNGPVGLYYSKTWNGTDYPPRNRTPRLVTFEVPEKSIVRPDGKTIVYSKRKIITKKVWDEPPKRARVEDHPYTCNWNRRWDPQMTWKNGAGGVIKTGSIVSCFGGPIFPPSYTFDNNDMISLLGKLRTKVAGSEFNLGVSLGESKLALQMITDGATRLYKSFLNFKRGNVIGALDVLTAGTPRHGRAPQSLRQRAANNWLELQYGILPLLSDVKAGAEFLAHNFNTPQQMVVRCQRSVSRDISANYQDPLLFVGYRKAVQKKSRAIKAILREKDVAVLSGITDPLSVAWELMPYSFVADWFIPIGNYLQARGLPSALTGTFVISTIEKTTVSQPFGQRGYVISDSGFTWELGNFNRSVSSSLQVPLPSVKPLSEALSWKRATNAVALLSQAFR